LQSNSRRSVPVVSVITAEDDKFVGDSVRDCSMLLVALSLIISTVHRLFDYERWEPARAMMPSSLIKHSPLDVKAAVQPLSQRVLVDKRDPTKSEKTLTCRAHIGSCGRFSNAV